MSFRWRFGTVYAVLAAKPASEGVANFLEAGAGRVGTIVGTARKRLLVFSE
jgi:hypothetical protein